MKNLVLPDYINTVLSQLRSCSYSAYLVGGCVRDILRGAPVHDYDITSNALPEQVIACFNNEKTITVGARYGTVGVVKGKNVVEITTFRTDGNYSDCRRPEKVVFGTTLNEDLCRRDFTVNAMALNENGTVIDLFGGQDDLKNKTVRCVGEPDKRFNEDALRMLRALRFASSMGFTVESKTGASIIKNRALLNAVSVERKYSEFIKILCGASKTSVLRTFLPVFAQIIPELQAAAECGQNTKYHCHNVFEHTLAALDNTPNEPVLLLAVLFHDLGKPFVRVTDENGRDHFKNHGAVSAQIAKETLLRLRVDKKTIQTVEMLVRYHDTRDSAAELLRVMPVQTIKLLASVKRADELAHAPGYNGTERADLLEKQACEAELRCPDMKSMKINGNDLPADVPKGKETGEILKTLFILCASGEIENEKTALISAAKRIYACKAVNKE